MAAPASGQNSPDLVSVTRRKKPRDDVPELVRGLIREGEAKPLGDRHSSSVKSSFLSARPKHQSDRAGEGPGPRADDRGLSSANAHQEKQTAARENPPHPAICPSGSAQHEEPARSEHEQPADNRAGEERERTAHGYGGRLSAG